MSVFALTPLAKADIFDIWSYIADESEDAAEPALNLHAIYPLRALMLRWPFLLRMFGRRMGGRRVPLWRGVLLRSPFRRTLHRREANSPDFRRLERPRRRRDFVGPEVNSFALLVSPGISQGLA